MALWHGPQLAGEPSLVDDEVLVEAPEGCASHSGSYCGSTGALSQGRTNRARRRTCDEPAGSSSQRTPSPYQRPWTESIRYAYEAPVEGDVEEHG